MPEKKKPGPKPIGDKAMTAAERKRAQRARQKEAKQADAYFAFPEAALKELTDIAETFGVSRSVLVSGIVEGQMNNLKSFAEAISKANPAVIDIPLRKHQALQAVYKGRNLDFIIQDVMDQILTHHEEPPEQPEKDSHE